MNGSEPTLRDISVTLNPDTPEWPGDTAFTCGWASLIGAGASVNVSSFTSSPHVGTHADAPLHVREGWSGAVPQQSLQPWPVGGLDAYRGAHRKPATVSPLRHVARVIDGEQTAAHEAVQQAAAHGGLYRGDGLTIEAGGRVEDDAPGRRRLEHAVEHHAVEM